MIIPAVLNNYVKYMLSISQKYKTMQKKKVYLNLRSDETNKFVSWLACKVSINCIPGTKSSKSY